MATTNDSSRTKVCTCCGDRKTLSEFYKRSDQPGKYRSHCKTCTEARTDRASRISRARAWRVANPGRPSVTAKAWRARNPDYDGQRWARDPAAGKARNRRNYQRHRAKRLAYQQKLNRIHAARIAAYRQQWWRDNPDRAAEYHNRRRAAKRNAGGTYTAADIKALFEKQKGRCAYCRKPLTKYHVDHVVALANGGSNWPSNLALACPKCNTAKRTKDAEEFMREQGFAL